MVLLFSSSCSFPDWVNNSEVAAEGNLVQAGKRFESFLVALFFPKAFIGVRIRGFRWEAPWPARKQSGFALERKSGFLAATRFSLHSCFRLGLSHFCGKKSYLLLMTHERREEFFPLFFVTWRVFCFSFFFSFFEVGRRLSTSCWVPERDPGLSLPQPLLLSFRR